MNIKTRTVQLTELTLTGNELCRQALKCIFEDDDFIIKTMSIKCDSANEDDPKISTVKVMAFFFYKEKEFDIELISAVRKDKVWKLITNCVHYAYINSEYSFVFKPTEHLKFSSKGFTEYQKEYQNKLKK